MKLRVLALCEHGSLNGGERSLLAVAERIGDHGIELTVAAPASGPLSRALAQQGIAHLPFDLTAGLAQAGLGQRRVRLGQLLQSQAPDIVHANSLVMSRLAGRVAASRGLASLGHLRDMMRISGAAARDLHCHGRLLAVSQAVRDWYVAAGVHVEKLGILYNGVDPGRFRPRPATGSLLRELGLPPGTKLALTIGQVILRKGLDVLLEAARLVLSGRSDTHFVVVGARFSDKPETVAYERELHRAAAGELCRGRIHFVGVRSDVEDLMCESTLLVHAARQEPLGRVLLEAAAAGLPVVATAVGGTPEIFGRDAALLVPPGEPAALAAAVERLLASSELRARLAGSARQIAVTRFGADRAAAGLAAHYRETWESRRGLADDPRAADNARRLNDSRLKGGEP